MCIAGVLTSEAQMTTAIKPSLPEKPLRINT